MATEDTAARVDMVGKRGEADCERRLLESAAPPLYVLIKVAAAGRTQPVSPPSPPHRSLPQPPLVTTRDAGPITLLKGCAQGCGGPGCGLYASRQQPLSTVVRLFELSSP